MATECLSRSKDTVVVFLSQAVSMHLYSMSVSIQECGTYKNGRLRVSKSSREKLRQKVGSSGEGISKMTSVSPWAGTPHRVPEIADQYPVVL